MRLLILAFMFVLTSVGAQDINEKHLPQQMSPADNRFVDNEVKAAGSKEEAAKHAVVRGWRYLKKGDTAAAIRRFNQAALLNPTYADAYWGLGAATSQQGKFDASILLFERAYVLDPKNVGLMADIGVAHMRRAMGNVQDSDERTKGLNEALAWFDKAEKIDPFYELTYANRAIALTFMGDYQKAWVNIERAEALNEESIDPKLISFLSERLPRPAPSIAALPAKTPQPEVAAQTKTQPLEQASAQVAAPASGAALPDAKTVLNSIAPSQPTAEAKAQPEAPPPIQAAAPASGSVVPDATTAQNSAAPSQPVTQQVTQPVVATFSKTEMEQTSEKQLRIVSRKSSKYKGRDMTYCLDLPTNEAIARCVYKSK